LKLEMPTINLDREVTVLATVTGVVQSLKNCALTWKKLISRVLEEQLKKVPQGHGPLAEIDLWREKNATLRALTEQIKLPEVQKVLEILQEADSEFTGDLQIVLSDLNKHQMEAQDNVKFLSTLERHLKNLSTGTGADVISNTIPSLLNALRMVWIMSRHYNKDERMVPLLERISWEISARVRKVVDVQTLFREDTRVAKLKVTEAKTTLEQWKKCYFTTCIQVEESGSERYWKFDVKRLFEKTDYMASICQELHDVFQVVIEELYNIFIPELTTVTENPKGIDGLRREVNIIISPMEDLAFDPFNMKNAHDWALVMEEFREDVTVEIVKQIFVQNHKNPPLYKNHPPVAGAISWSRFLFRRIQHTIIRFQEVEELLATERGKEVKQIYLQVAKKLKEYEDQKYRHWRERTEHILPLLLKDTLLTSSATEEPVTTKKSICFALNFSPEIQEIIIETKYMEQLGLPVPEMARYVALQEDKYLRYTSKLKAMLDRYHKLMDMMNEAETKLLDDYVQELWKILKAGHKRLTWKSVGIGEFIVQCTQTIGKLELLVHQIHHVSEDISSKLRSIESTNLFKFPRSKNGDKLPGAKEFFDYVKCEQVKDVEHMVRKYSAIPQLLIEVEGRVANTNSGKSPKLASYYAYWEHRIYQVLTQLVVKNLQAFNATVLANVPLLQIEAVISLPEVTLQPNANEIEKMTVQAIQDCVEVTKRFVRWMHGTCIECPPQHVKADEVVTFSFYSDVSQSPLIIEQAVLITGNVHKLLASLNKCLNQWKKYDQVWKSDKGAVLDRLAAEKPACVIFDEHLQFYMKVAQEVTQRTMIKDEQFIRLQLAPLASAVQENAKSWVMSLGKLLNELAREELFRLRDEIQVGVLSL
ncbi:DYH10 protein, partial [Pachycephala philippinensis]|nr:DYH10 protein [Pachycephala philippinensis]